MFEGLVLEDVFSWCLQENHAALSWCLRRRMDEVGVQDPLNPKP